MRVDENVDKLLVIADDFTGALDTGIQFVNRGARTKVEASIDSAFSTSLESIDVLAVNAATRHLPATNAYHIVYDLVKRGKSLGFSYIYKKTDSGLRGNIGSELAAAVDAAAEKNIVFVSAFPKTNRTTENGIQLINGIPVAQSVFGNDPFNPVTVSRVKEIIALQTATPVIEHFSATRSLDQTGIHIFDSRSDEDLRRIISQLGKDQLHLCAGCAGFSAALADVLEFGTFAEEEVAPIKKLFVVCGSINPVTVQQLDVAEAAGLGRINLTAEQKENMDWLKTPIGEMTVKQWKMLIESNDGCILDVNSDENFDLASAPLSQEAERLRVQIANGIGGIVKKLLDSGLEATLLCVGGDTLQAVISTLQVKSIRPISEFAPGVVLAEFQYMSKKYHIITKSGGFGSPELIYEIAVQITKKGGLSHAKRLP